MLYHYYDSSGSIYREIRARTMKEVELRISRLLQRVFLEGKKSDIELVDRDANGQSSLS